MPCHTHPQTWLHCGICSNFYGFCTMQACGNVIDRQNHVILGESLPVLSIEKWYNTACGILFSQICINILYFVVMTLMILVCFNNTFPFGAFLFIEDFGAYPHVLIFLLILLYICVNFTILRSFMRSRGKVQLFRCNSLLEKKKTICWII